MKQRVVVLLAAILFVAVAGSYGNAGTGEQQLTLTMTVFGFTPANVSLRAGAPVRLLLVNKDTIEHEFMVFETPKSGMVSVDLHDWALERSYFLGLSPRVESAGVEVERREKDVVMVKLRPGETAFLRFTPRKTGAFAIGCLIPGHEEAGMRGTFTVR